MAVRLLRVENPVLTLVLIVGLTCLNIWPDLVGHGSAFLPSATLVQGITNGRVFFNLGLGCAAGVYALAPRWLATHDDAVLALVAAVSVVSAIGYAACPSIGLPAIAAGALAFGVGAGYGAFLVRFMCQLAQSGGMGGILIACASSLILKTAIDLGIGLLGDCAQVGATLAMPVAARGTSHTCPLWGSCRLG